jgi:1,4-dihydroxy-2-naphthoyl-CoA hydrolase
MHIFYNNINFYDCDPAGVLFFGRIFEICHSAYEDLINSFMLSFNYWNNENYAVPIIHTEADYFLPLKTGDKILIEVVVSQLKESSFELRFVCKNEQGNSTNEIKTVHIFVDKKMWKKTPLNSELKEKLAKHLSL